MLPEPVCFHIGRLPIHWYGVTMAMAFMAGLVNWIMLGRREQRDTNYCSDLLFWIMVSGIIGARAAYVAADLRHFVTAPWTALRVDQGGLIYYGGFAGAAVAVILFARLRRERLWPLADFVVTSLPLAHAIGRIGCLLNGCCYGRVSQGPLAVRYPPDSAPWWEQVETGLISRFSPSSLPVLPVQLYEAAWNLLLYSVLLCVFRRRQADGVVTGIYLLGYAAGRFLLEPLRGDARMRWLGLSVAQLVSLALLAGGGLLLAWSRGNARRARTEAPAGPAARHAGRTKKP
jgi:phosphatidylglycerol:prolipoprotein diacylglycerol transferase